MEYPSKFVLMVSSVVNQSYEAILQAAVKRKYALKIVGFVHIIIMEMWISIVKFKFEGRG